MTIITLLATSLRQYSSPHLRHKAVKDKMLDNISAQLDWPSHTDVFYMMLVVMQSTGWSLQHSPSEMKWKPHCYCCWNMLHVPYDICQSLTLSSAICSGADLPPALWEDNSQCCGINVWTLLQEQSSLSVRDPIFTSKLRSEEVDQLI